MDSKDREVKYKEQTDSLFTSIGKFTVKFEHISHALQMGIIFLLHQGGLTKQPLAKVILAGLTARPLQSIFQAMIPELIDLDDQDKRIVNAILNRTVDIIEKRNEVIHSTWLVGWASQEQTDFSVVDGYKYSRGKIGASVKSFKYKASDFDELSKECDYVTKLINRLWCCISGDNKISKNFEVNKVNKKDEVSLPIQS